MSNPTSNFGWQMPTATDLVTDLPADFEVFGQAVDTALMDLKGGTTNQVLAKNSNTDMDFKWVADAAGMTNPMTTTGDMIYSSSGSTPARLGIGTSGQVIGIAAGVPAWTTPASGGSALISRTSFSNVASVDYDSVFTTAYGSYLIVIEDIAAATDSDDLHIQLRYGSTTHTGDYYSTYNKSTTAAATYVGTASTGTAQWVATDQMGSTGGYPVSGWFCITNADGTNSTRIGATGQFVNNSYNTFFSFNGTCSSSQAWSGFRIKSSSTNITGTIAVYGNKV